MLSDRASAALRDILHHINLAMHFTGGIDLAVFKDDLRTFYAVTRCLEIISEASRRLPSELNPLATDGGRGEHLPARL